MSWPWWLAIAAWTVPVADLLLWANRKLACVGWAFYHAAMVLAEHKRALDGEAIELWQPVLSAAPRWDCSTSLIGTGAITARPVHVHVPEQEAPIAQLSDDPRHQPWTFPPC